MGETLVEQIKRLVPGGVDHIVFTSDGGTPAQWTVYVTTDEGATWNQMGPAALPGNPGEITIAPR